MAIAEPYRPDIRLRGWASVRRRKNSLGRLSISNWVALSAPLVITIFALLVPSIAPQSPDIPVGEPFSPPGHGFLLGSDEVGRDVFSRVLYGMRTSWFASLEVIVCAVAVGALIGLLAGGIGGWVDTALMRLTDIVLALPGPILAIAVVAALGPSLRHTLVAVLLVWWPFYARIIRGEIRTLSARPHIEAARLAEAGRIRILGRHLLPGAVPVIVVTASLDMGNVVLTLAGLSFLGLGAPAPAPELGAMAASGIGYLLQQWWVAVVPAAAVCLLAFMCNLTGDGLRSILVDR